MKFSETVFVYPPEAGRHGKMRIFTPNDELPFAGHPIIGTAFVLAAPMQLGVINLETGRGIVPVELERDGARIVFARMKQPVPEIRMFEHPEALFAALGVAGSGLPGAHHSPGPRPPFASLRSAGAVPAPGPRFAP